MSKELKSKKQIRQDFAKHQQENPELAQHWLKTMEARVYGLATAWLFLCLVPAAYFKTIPVEGYAITLVVSGIIGKLLLPVFAMHFANCKLDEVSEQSLKKA